MSTSRTKKGRLASSGWEVQKDPLSFRMGDFFMKSWGPVSGGSCRKASPVMREATTPKLKGVFAPVKRPVLRMEKAFPRPAGSCLDGAGGGGLSLLRTDSPTSEPLPQPLSVYFLPFRPPPPSLWGRRSRA